MVFVATPLVAAIVRAGAAGVLGVFLSKLLGVSLSPRQANVSYIGFPVMFGLFGLIDSANRLIALLAHRRGESRRRSG
jgi:hypothetical protein